MKPIELKMVAFGAYVKPTELNFEHGLGDAKIFLINGATGAGKTTILDAITYALYGETSGKIRDAKDMRSKGVADDVLTEIEFTFSLGRRIYKIRREINFNSRRKENKYLARAVLFRDGNLIADKDRIIKNKVVEILGFDADQFRQVILLPQGQFQKFLSADPKERQDILNVLFDSEPYRRVEEALLERAKDSAEKVLSLENRCADLEKRLQSAGSDSLAEIERKLFSVHNQAADFKDEADRAQLSLTEGKILATKFIDFQKANSDLRAAQTQFFAADKNFSAAQAEYQKRVGEEARREELKKLADKLSQVQTDVKNFDLKQEELKLAEEKFKVAEAGFKRCSERVIKYEARMNFLTQEKARFECEKIWGEIFQLEDKFSVESKKLANAEKILNAAQIELTRLQIVNNAAHLAIHLKDGEPCPVCGSVEHPAIISAAIPSVAELQAADEKVKRFDREKSCLEKVVAKIEGELSARKNLLADNPEAENAKKTFVNLPKTLAELEKCLRSLELGTKYTEKNNAELKAEEKNKNDAENIFKRLEGEISAMTRNIPEIYLGNRAQLDADLKSAQKEFSQLDFVWKAADKNFHDAGKIKSAREATLKSAQKVFDNLQKELEGKTPPDIEFLQKKATAAQESYSAAIRETARLENILNTIKESSAELATVQKELDAVRKKAEMWRGLSDVANGTGRGESEMKISFQRYFLSTMFNEVVIEANNRLKKMSGGRYLFLMKDAGKRSNSQAGLNLEIFDEYTGAFRPIETLSGGESFLASLSLALGLAAVVRNKVGGIRLDTIFIDEGFGSLDSETLDFAISAIIEQSGGRLVGIISHVEELKNQIPVRLEVQKDKTGSIAKFIGAR